MTMPGRYYEMTSQAPAHQQSADLALTFDALPEESRKLLLGQLWRVTQPVPERHKVEYFETTHDIANWIKAGGFNSYYPKGACWWLSQHGANVVISWIKSHIDQSPLSARFNLS